MRPALTFWTTLYVLLACCLNVFTPKLCSIGLLGGARDAEMLAATANAYLFQQQQSPSTAPAGPYSTAAAAAAAAMMMLPPPSPLPVPVPLTAAVSDVSRASPASSGVDLGLRPSDVNVTHAHLHAGNGGRFVQTMADG